MKLTKPQYEALAKWEKYGPSHYYALGVRYDVYDRLFDAGYLEARQLIVRQITDKGREALAAYRAKGKS